MTDTTDPTTVAPPPGGRKRDRVSHAGLSVEAAREGREKMKRRCWECAEHFTHPSVKLVKFRKDLTGRIYFDKDLHGFVVESPKPNTRKSLYVYLHEVGHIGHFLMADRIDGRRMRAWEMEAYAEFFAARAMQKSGIPVPRKMVALGKEYVLHKMRVGDDISRRLRGLADE